MARFRRLSRSSHRWLGVIVALPLIIASVTGVILNHTVDLGLSEKRVTSAWVQSRYGIALSGEAQAYKFEGEVIAGLWDSQVFFRDTTFSVATDLVGAVPLRNGTAIVLQDAVHYYGLDGELIETLDETSLPSLPIEKAGRTDELTLVLVSQGNQYVADADLFGFSAFGEATGLSYSETTDTPPELKEHWRRVFLGDGIPMDRVILDLHSGKILGPIGKWLWDLVVIAVLILSITGFVLFFKNRRRAK